MDALRFYTLAASLFVATFAGGLWILSPPPANSPSATGSGEAVVASPVRPDLLLAEH